MFCKYCGKELDEKTQFCSSCGKQIVVSAKEGTSTSFYLILFVGPILLFLSNIIILLDYVGRYPELMVHNLVTALPLASIIFIVIALRLAKTRKIDSTCFESYDVITWSVFPLALAIYNRYERLAVSQCGETMLVSFSLYQITRDIVMFSSIWYYGCLLLFLRVRCGTVKIGKKTIIKSSIVLVVWSFIILLFGHRILQMLGAMPETMGYSFRLLRFSACFMWVRYLILLWFAILMGQRKIGFICGIMCAVGTFFAAGVAMALFIDKGLAPWVGFSESIGYLVFGLVVLVASLIHKKAK